MTRASTSLSAPDHVRSPDQGRSAIIDRRRFLTQTAAAGAAALAPPALAADETLAPSAMQGDVALLRKAYEALHPGLYRYATPAATAARLDALRAVCARPMSLPAFYLELSRLLATVRCGHSYANFFNQSQAVQAALFNAPDRLPVQFLWLGPRMIVTRDPTRTLAPGTEVLALDGLPAGAVLARLMTVARADGGNDGKRRRLLSVQGEDGYETFDVFHPLLFGSRPRHWLTVRGPDGRRREVMLPSITLAERRAQRPLAASAADDTPAWTVERRGAAAVLTMPGWGLYNTKWNWRSWLDATFDRLAADRMGGLVIDLRANEGGDDDCARALAARLTDRPVTPAAWKRLVRYRRVPPGLRPHLDTWDRRFDDWGTQASSYDDRFLLLAPEGDGGGPVRPKGPRFPGRVAVLVGPQNSSSTFAFAELVRRERLGVLVGETTGGNRRGINGGAFYFLRLPATGLEVDLPLIGYFSDRREPDAGLEPDVHVPLTAEAIAAGRDEAMARALELVA